MSPPPAAINGARVVCFAKIEDGIKPTGATTHWRDGRVLHPAKALAICQHAGEKHFYLLYCGEQWDVLTDTFHLTLDDAKRQAEFEYAGISSHWHPGKEH